MSSDSALLVVAHGSRREISNDEVRSLVNGLAKSPHDFARVGCAFLELAQPSIPDALRAMIADGFERIVVLPYFLSAGRHVAEDIPGEIREVQTEFPDVVISLASYLGTSEAITGILLDLAADAPG